MNRVGHAYGSLYGYRADGLFKTQEEADAYTQQYGNPFGATSTFKAGDLRYKDVDGDGKLTPDDRDILGSVYPKATFGLNPSVTWKNFDLSIFMLGTAGVSRYFNDQVWGDFSNGETSHPSTAWFDAWSPENPNGSFPRICGRDVTASYPRTTSSFWMRSTSYLRVKNLQIGYELPQNSIKGTGISRVKIYYSGENLITIDNLPINIDPETDPSIVGGSQYPIMKTHSIGITLSF